MGYVSSAFTLGDREHKLEMFLMMAAPPSLLIECPVNHQEGALLLHSLLFGVNAALQQNSMF